MNISTAYKCTTFSYSLDPQVCILYIHLPLTYTETLPSCCHSIVFFFFFHVATSTHTYTKKNSGRKRMPSLALLRTFIFELFRLYFIFLNIWYCTLLYFIAYAFHSRAHILTRQIARKKEREMATTSLTWSKEEEKN